MQNNLNNLRKVFKARVNLQIYVTFLLTCTSRQSHIF